MKRYLLIVGAAVLLLAAFAWAQSEYSGYGSPYAPYGATDLKLTTDQQKKLADLEVKYLADIQSINTQIAQKDIDLRRLLLAEKPDTKAIEKLENEIVKLQNKHYDVTLDYRNKSRSILTDEQLKTNPYAFMGPGLCPYYGGGMMGGYGGYGPGYGGMMGGYGGGMMRGYGPGYGGGMMRGWGPGW
jgi:Spy/CpxP family protein refolding chaperone